jgi:iron complex outermembrane receptor protein
LYLFPPSNPDLLPEEAWNYEFSLTRSWKELGLHTEITGYYIKGENLIQEVLINNPPPKRQNIGSFINKGIEYHLRYKPNPYWDVHFNYHYLDASTNVLYSPDHHIHFRTHFHKDKLTGTVHLRQVWGLQNTLEAGSLKENYTIINTRLQYSIFKHTIGYLEVNNLLDTKYEIDRFFPMPGINFLVGMRFDFTK